MTMTVVRTGTPVKCRLCAATVAIRVDNRLRSGDGMVTTDRGTFTCRKGHPNDLAVVDDETTRVGERL